MAAFPFVYMVPITLFLCVAWTITKVVEARMRNQLLQANRPDELVRTMLLNEERQRRYSSLRWGIVLTFLALGFAVIEAFGWDDVSPGIIAVLLGSTGVGNIASYWIANRLDQRRQGDGGLSPSGEHR